MKPVEVNVKFLYHLETSETTDFLFLEGTKEKVDPKWVKQQQYRRQWHNFMLLAWSASCSIVK